MTVFEREGTRPYVLGDGIVTWIGGCICNEVEKQLTGAARKLVWE